MASIKNVRVRVAGTADCSVPAAKSALQRGRANLKTLTANQEDIRLPLLSDDERCGC
jgi:hypothetical protein